MLLIFNAQRQAAFLQATASFMGIAQTLLKISSINGVAYNRRYVFDEEKLFPPHVFGTVLSSLKSLAYYYLAPYLSPKLC